MKSKRQLQKDNQCLSGTNNAKITFFFPISKQVSFLSGEEGNLTDFVYFGFLTRDLAKYLILLS